MHYSLKCEIDEGTTETKIPMYPGNLIKKVLEFCTRYKKDPMKNITHLIDRVSLQNYYNDFLYHLSNYSITDLLIVAECLILPLLKLICYKLSYIMRDTSIKYRLHSFNLYNKDYNDM